MSKTRRSKSRDVFSLEEKKKMAARKIIESMPAEIDRIKAERERKIWETRNRIRKFEEEANSDQD